jgi:miniconductance mechanosensitive channel
MQIAEQWSDHAWAITSVQLLLLVLLVMLVRWIAVSFLMRAVSRAVQLTPTKWDNAFLGSGVLTRLAHLAPALVAYYGINFVSGLPAKIVPVTRALVSSYIALAVAMAFSSLLAAVSEIYEDHNPARALSHPIKSYLQVGTIAGYAIAVILIVAMLFNRDPLILLSGLGAMTAVLMLVFKDTLLSLVASVQLATNDMLRVHDWIEMPQLSADGDVIDITLHTVKVRNFDQTITTIPTWRMISESFRNWRGVHESGGRRIKRAILLDQTSIRFLEPAESVDLQRFLLIEGYLRQKQSELERHNAELIARGCDPVNARRVTNAGTFRAYVYAYLRAHKRVRQHMDLLVRQLPPGPTGLPLEVYCFTSTDWQDYEDVQADIFDHLYAILPEFGLRVFQQPGSVRAQPGSG